MGNLPDERPEKLTSPPLGRDVKLGVPCLDAKPADTTSPSLPGGSQDPLCSTHAVSLPPKCIKISNLNLANRNVLWCPVSSAGVSLPLPLDTCCSVSLVSQQHADHILKSRPDLQFLRIERHVSVSVAVMHMKHYLFNFCSFATVPQI